MFVQRKELSGMQKLNANVFDIEKMEHRTFIVRLNSAKNSFSSVNYFNPEIHPSYPFCEVPSKCQLRLETKIENFSDFIPEL